MLRQAVAKSESFGKCAKFLSDGVIILALLFALFLSYGIIPNRWYQILVVNSGSMAPVFNAGDLIVITRPPKELEPGMVLTFVVDDHIVTHRLAGFNSDGSLITIGDANPTFDDWGSSKVTVHGLYRFRIPYLGYLIAIFQ